MWKGEVTMVIYDRLSPGNKRYLDLNPKNNNNIGLPIKLADSNTYYPIYQENLFLRYYITINGYIYDSLTEEILKFNIDDIINFNATDSDNVVSFSIRSLIWKTFYRFKNGQFITQYSKDNRYSVHIRYVEEDGDRYYIIEGIDFRPVTIPENSRAYRHLIKNDNCRLLISEDGAVFNLQNNKFFLVTLDQKGIPIIRSKRGHNIQIQELLACAECSNSYDPSIHVVTNSSFSDIFVNRDNISVYNPVDLSVVYSPLIIQNLCTHHVHFLGIVPYMKYKFGENPSTIQRCINKEELERRYGKFYMIPISGMYPNYWINKCGIIYCSRTKRILSPYKMVFEKNSQIPIDILYRIPSIRKVCTISELMMWVFYRISKDMISDYRALIMMDPLNNVPIVEDLVILSKHQPYQFDDSCIIGTEIYRRANRVSNVYISINGTLFDSATNSFVQVYGFDSNLSYPNIMIPYRDKHIEVNIYKLMYECWFNMKTIRNTSVVTRNKIPGDISLHNLTLSFNSNSISRNHVRATKLKEVQFKLNEIHNAERCVIKSIYENRIDNELFKK